MKIPPSTPRVTGGAPAQAGETGRAKGTSGKASGAPVAGADVKLSALSTRLQGLAADLAAPTFDRSKVEQIKQAIRDGKLSVNTDVVAEKMIEDLENRLGSRGK